MNLKDKKRIQELKELIVKYDKQYYEEGVSEISDAEYDRLYEEYMDFETKYPELKDLNDSPSRRVGAGNLAGTTSGLPKYTHKSPLLSINHKSKELDDLKAFYESIGGDGTEVIIEPKLDGITVNINYEDGKFVNAATRGNGYIGDLITENFQNTLTTYPKTLSNNASLELRGEAIIPYNFFKENLSKDYSNPRNAVAGLMRSLNPEDVKDKGIQVMFYDIGKTHKIRFDDKDDDNINFIKQLEFDSIPVLKAASWQELKLIVESKLNKKIKEIDGFNILVDENYPHAVCDGLVIKVNDLKKREELGMTEKGPRWAFAYKFKPLQTITRIDHIEWQVGKNGTIVPVGVFDEISLGGVKITRATLNNIEYMKNLPVLYSERSVWINRSYDNWGELAYVPFYRIFHKTNAPIRSVEYIREGDILIDSHPERSHSELEQLTVKKVFDDGFWIHDDEYDGEWYPFEEGRYYLLNQTPGLQADDFIIVERSNDVIPKIIAIHHRDNGVKQQDLSLQIQYMKRQETFQAPLVCPVCGSTIKKIGPQIFCQNPNCSARKLGQFEQFVSRDGMNIIGLGSSILEELLSKGIIKSYADIYKLPKHKEEILQLDNFGEKKYNNLIKSIENSKNIPLANFIYALGIPLVGKKTAKDLAKFYKTADTFVESQIIFSHGSSIKNIEDIGDKTVDSIKTYAQDNWKNMISLLEYVTPEAYLQESSEELKGKTFVITGTLANPRQYYQELIEKHGGKVSGNVSKRTYGVFVGDNAGSKEKKARDLVSQGANILIFDTEESIMEFLKNV